MDMKELLDATMSYAFSKPDETESRTVTVRVCVSTYVFQAERLYEQRHAIAGMIARLPDEFRKSKGGGQSFLNMCVDRDGVQWGEHADCDALLALAIGTSQGGFCMPRTAWSMFPGGMPYVWLGS